MEQRHSWLETGLLISLIVSLLACAYLMKTGGTASRPAVTRTDPAASRIGEPVTERQALQCTRAPERDHSRSILRPERPTSTCATIGWQRDEDAHPAINRPLAAPRSPGPSHRHLMFSRPARLHDTEP